MFRHAQTPKGPVEAGGRIGVSLGAASTCGPGTDGGAQRRAPDRPQTRRNGAQSLDNRDVAGLAPIPPQDPRYAGDQAALVERPTGRPRMSGLSTECWVALNGERNPRVPRNNIFLLERCARRGPPGAPATASEAGVVGADGADRRDGPFRLGRRPCACRSGAAVLNCHEHIGNRSSSHRTGKDSNFR